MCCSFQLFFFISSPLPFSFFLFLPLSFLEQNSFIASFPFTRPDFFGPATTRTVGWCIWALSSTVCLLFTYIYIYIISLLSSLRSSKRSLRRTLRCSFRSRQIQSSSHRLMRWCLTTQRFTKIHSQSSSWWQQCKLFHRWRTILFLFTLFYTFYFVNTHVPLLLRLHVLPSVVWFIYIDRLLHSYTAAFFDLKKHSSLINFLTLFGSLIIPPSKYWIASRTRMMRACGIYDFSLQDITSPGQKRVRCLFAFLLAYVRLWMCTCVQVCTFLCGCLNFFVVRETHVTTSMSFISK